MGFDEQLAVGLGARDAAPAQGTATELRSPPERLLLTAWEQELRTSGIQGLERAVEGIHPERLTAWFDADPGLQEVAVLKTCQRLLLLALTEDAEPADRLGDRLASMGVWGASNDRAAIHHLFRVAAGFESIATGEREVRDQVRLAASTVVSRHPRPLLRRVLLEAARAAADVEVAGAHSVADLGADWLRSRLSDRSVPILVIGGGRVARRVVERLRGLADVTMLYHSRPPEPAWAAERRVRSRRFGDLRAVLASSEGVVAAAKASGRLISLEDLPPPGSGGPRWFVDLGMPRNIDPRVGGRPGTELVDLEGLQPSIPRDPAALSEAQRKLAEAADESAVRFARAAAEPWVRALRNRAEAVRSAEFEQALEFAGPVPDLARAAFHRMSERIVTRLLAGPTEELRGLSPEPDHDPRRQKLLDRFSPPDDP
ncbi:MAG: hypothetical protein ACREDK_07345 [Thermoplasmata archaeon]